MFEDGGERGVIGREEGVTPYIGPDGAQAQFAADVDAIEIDDGQKSGVGVLSETAQELGEMAVDVAVGGFLVEVAEEDAGLVLDRGIGENLRRNQARGLITPFGAAQTEMHGEDVDDPRSVRPGDVRAEAGALLALRNADRIEAGIANGEAAEDGVAEVVAVHVVGVAVEEIDAELPGDFLGLLGAHFLKGNDIGVDFAEDAGDALGPDARIKALAGADVIGDDAQPRRVLSGRHTIRRRRALKQARRPG